MGKSFKRKIALLLTAAMLLTTNAVVYAGQTLSSAALNSDSESSERDTDPRLVSLLTTDDQLVTPVSSIKDEPTTWSKAPEQAKYTFGRFLPELYGYSDNDMVDMTMIVNGKKVTRPAVSINKLSNFVNVSFNCIPLTGGKYMVYAYGVKNEFDYSEAVSRESISLNNYYGITPDGVPAGVFDYTPFSWYKKSGGLKANGNIIFEAAIISWSSGNEAKKERIYEVSKLNFKNNIYATVSFNAVDGKWVRLNRNGFQKSRDFSKLDKNQPSFYPVFTTKKSYRAADGTKVKATKENRNALKALNKEIKKDTNKIKFEIRRRPIAGTVSEDYIDDRGEYYTPYKYVSLMGDDLSFKKNGKLKKAVPQFKSLTYTKDTDDDSDEQDEESEAGQGNSSAKASGFYLTHVLKIVKLLDSDANDANIGKKIENGELRDSKLYYRKKVDAWFTTKKIGGSSKEDETLIVYGANNLEGVAAFRQRADNTIGSGYYKNDNDCFILSLDD